MAANLTNKVFSGINLMQLIKDTEVEAKARFANEETEIKLSLFLLVRKAFNESYEKIREYVTENGKLEIGETFSGITGNFITAPYSARGGSKYIFAGEDKDLDPNLVEKVVTVTYKVNQKAVDDYRKQNRELPEFIEEAPRAKSLSISPTKEAKALFDEMQKDKDDILYSLEIPEITDEEAV